MGLSKANAEYVVVHNTAAKAKNIRGWFIRENKLKRTFTFPCFTLRGGCLGRLGRHRDRAPRGRARS
ncbi:MAG: hypothetical protein ACRDQC_07005, partial [Gaiellales bacterium]